ncbi:MAG TPA: thioredoxin [Clostridiales bacterium]|nr:thioredoxin [Clostridiales bacterium]
METIKITNNNFEEEVLNSKEPVLLDFWAAWCGPCKMVAPILDEVAKEVSGKAKIGKINIDEESQLASQFRVMSIPTFMVIKDGKVAATSVGMKGKNELLKMLEI